jgi:hypothetical protein
MKRILPNDFEQQIINAIELGSTVHPMVSVYKVCRLLQNPQISSTDRFYVRVYRAMENLVAMGMADVARGTRDPSVYILYSMLKDYNRYGMREIPF